MPEQPKVAERPDIEALRRLCAWHARVEGDADARCFLSNRDGRDLCDYALGIESSLRKVMTLAQESADVPARFERKIQDILREAGLNV